MASRVESESPGVPRSPLESPGVPGSPGFVLESESWSSCSHHHSSVINTAAGVEPGR